MPTIHYEASERRLEVEGEWLTIDRATLPAVETFARLAGDLVVDLSGVTEISRDVASALVATVRHAEAEEGLSIELQTAPETAVARAVDGSRGWRVDR